MRIAIVGTGGVGAGYGAALAKAGADVTFIARGAHLAAMKRDGLKVQSQRGDIHLVPTQATDNPAEIGKVDFVLFCVKLWDVESAGETIKPLIGPDTAVIPLQNGVDAADRLIPILGENAVMGGVAQISANIIASGVIQQVGTFMRMVFGELDGRSSPRGEAFLALCLKAGFDAKLSDAILTELWMKFILLAANASAVALARQPIGALRDDPDIRPVLLSAYREVMDVGRAYGVALPDNAVETTSAIPTACPRIKSHRWRSTSSAATGWSCPARRQGGRARQEARRADADAQPDVCDAEALRYGQACGLTVARRHVLYIAGQVGSVATTLRRAAMRDITENICRLSRTPRSGNCGRAGSRSDLACTICARRQRA